jgi:hypothetical protein
MMMLVALALLATLAPSAFAGPPDGASGQMVLDEVADGVRQYRKETDSEKRIQWLEKLAPTRDPRVALTLAAALTDHLAWFRRHASLLLLQYYDGRRLIAIHEDTVDTAQCWLEKNEADLRRRARELP